MLSKPQLPTGRTFLMLFLLLSPILLSSVTAVSAVAAVSTTTTVQTSITTAVSTSSSPCSTCQSVVDLQEEVISSVPTGFASSGPAGPVRPSPGPSATNSTTSIPAAIPTSTSMTAILSPSTAAAASPSTSAQTTVTVTSSSTYMILLASSTTTTVLPVTTTTTTTSAVSVSSVQSAVSAELSSSLTAVIDTNTTVLPAIVPVASPQGSSPSGSASVSPSVTSLFVIGTQTITAGGFPITVSGIPISLAPSASAVVVGTSIEVLGPPTPAPVLTIAGTTVTANAASEFVVGTQTIAPGGPPVTISGTFVSLEPSGSTVVIGSSTHALVAAPILTIGGSTFTANAVGQYIINNERLIPGAAPITVSGTTISLAPSATALVIGTSTRALINAAAGPTSTLTLPTQTVVLPVLTLAGSTVTANAQSNYVVAGQTLSAGAPAITVSGTPISLAPSESLLAIGTSTEIVTVTNTLPKPTNRLPAMYPSTGLQLKPLSSSHILLAFLGSALFWGLL